MSTAHLSVKVGSVGKASPHAAYIQREGIYAERLNQGEKLEATESGNMPKWAKDNPNLFWEAADLYERKNGYVYREHEIALPRELNPQQRVELVQDWVNQELGDKHAYTWAIHNKTALDGGAQPHVHLMYSERINDGIERDPSQYFKRYNSKNPERGGAKKHNIQGTHKERAENLKEQRDRWEKLHNEHLQKHGHKSIISMKSLAEQGIERIPDNKMTPSESAALHRKAEADRNAKPLIEEIKREQTKQLAQQPIMDIYKQLKQVMSKLNIEKQSNVIKSSKMNDISSRLETVNKAIDGLDNDIQAYKEEYKQLKNQGFIKRFFSRDRMTELEKQYLENRGESKKLNNEKIDLGKQYAAAYIEAVNSYTKPLLEEKEKLAEALNQHDLNEFDKELSEYEDLLYGDVKNYYDRVYSNLHDNILNNIESRELGERLHRCAAIEFIEQNNLVAQSMQQDFDEQIDNPEIDQEQEMDIDDYEMDGYELER